MAKKWFRKGARLEKAASGLTAQLKNELDRLPDDLNEAQIAALEPEAFQQVEYNEWKAESTGYSNYSYWRCTWQAFWKNGVARFLLIALCALLIFTVIQPYLPGQKDPNQIFNTVDKYGKTSPMKNQAPSGEFWFGTDAVGHDLWARMWSGTRTSLLIGLIVAALNAFVGILGGLLWGYVRKLDFLFTELYNLVNNIPSTIILILASYVMRPGVKTIIIAMCITGWIGLARFIRNQVVIIRDRDYNLASRCLGTPTRRIIVKNLLPQMVSVVMLQMALAIPGAIGSEVFLAYIGLGLPIKTPSLGNLVNKGRAMMMAPTLRYQLIIPAVILSIITICFYLVGNAFSDAADPRNHV